MNTLRRLLLSFGSGGRNSIGSRAKPVTAPTGKYLRKHQSFTVVLGMAVVTTLLPFLILLPPFSGFSTQTSWVQGFASAGIYVLLALGLNVVVGLAGLLDLGYAAFFAIGAYTYAYGASPFAGTHFPFWPILLVGALVAAVFGILLGAPTLRLRGDYLAIVTLGFGEIVPVVFRNADTFTNGTNGIGGMYRPALPVFGTFLGLEPVPYYITVAVLVTVAMILLYRIQESRLGRAWMAIREDELAAASMGINTVTSKLLAFAIGASTAGMGGVLYASKVTIISPDSFGFTVSFTILAMVVLGGMGNVWGVAAGAFVVYEIQSELLKQLNGFVQTLNLPAVNLGVITIDISKVDFLQYQFLLYGLALVGMMLLRPEGLFPIRRRQQELRDTDDSAAANEELAQA